jgi:nicotinate-nucleotide adenylyltransferase
LAPFWGLFYWSEVLDLKEQAEQCRIIGAQFTFMPLSHSSIPHPVIIDSVTFFGGSFNPFHQGHLACLDLCPEKNIIIIPDRNPQKELRNFLPYDEYLLILKNLIDRPYYVYPGFWADSKKNPTYTWLPFVNISEKNLLMGDDSFMNILSWEHPDKILKALSKLYVVPRKFHEENVKGELEVQRIKLKEINPKLQIIFLDDHSFKHFSSTELRKLHVLK